jgi:hypothetical protein|tara:strand:- start:3571 stop:3732 length:162 start_codon:yes stop_codon:yes gene_type:complete
MNDAYEDKEMFMLNYIFNVRTESTGVDRVNEAHEAWSQYLWYCSSEENVVKAN